MDLSFIQLQNFFPFKKKTLKLPFWAKVSGLTAALLMGSIFTLLFIQTHHQKMNSLAQEVTTLVAQAHKAKKQKELHQKWETKRAYPYPHYIQQSIETLPLLQKEHEHVRTLLAQFPDNLHLKERLLFLESDHNQIRFDVIREGNTTEFHMAHRVQMDLTDLKKFLESVEGDRYDATQHKPFLFMKKFDLIKCYEKGDEKVYSIYAEFLQK